MFEFNEVGFISLLNSKLTFSVVYLAEEVDGIYLMKLLELKFI